MTKTREITITESKGAFSIFRKPAISKEEYDFSELSSLRQLLSNEKARLLHVIKTASPGSIYELARKLGRTFKSVNDDIKLLEKFGFIEFRQGKTGRRKALIPTLVSDKISLIIEV